MTNPAYYKDGVPYDASGSVIITITGGPISSVTNLNPSPNSPFPVLVNWPGMGGPHGGGGGLVDYNPRNLPFTGLWSIREGQAKINELLNQARQTFPQNAEQIRDEADALLADLRSSGLINNPEISVAAHALQEAVNSLRTNIDLKNQTEYAVISASQESEKAFLSFMNDKRVRLSNFINKNADMIDVAITVSGRGPQNLWEQTVTPKFSAEIEEKNKLVTYLDRVKTITQDVAIKKNALGKVKNRVEAQARAKADAEAREKALENAIAREKAQAQARAKADAEAREKALENAIAREKAQAEARVRAINELFAKAGVKPAPVYTSQMLAKANAALTAPDVMVLNQTPGSVQMAMAGAGVWTVTGYKAGTIGKWFVEALSKLIIPEVSTSVRYSCGFRLAACGSIQSL